MLFEHNVAMHIKRTDLNLIIIVKKVLRFYNKLSWYRTKEILYGDGLACEVSQTNPTPECELNNTKFYGG